MNRKGISFLQPKGIDNFSEFGVRLVSAVNEFLDNAIAAGAKNIIIVLINDGEDVSLMILEDGPGMNGRTLQYALSFGGENEGIEPKVANDLGKFHAGITIASLGLSDHTDIFSNGGDGWVKNYIDKEEIKETGEVYESEECDMPESAISLLEKVKGEQGLDVKIKTGTIVLIEKIDKEIIGPYNFKGEVDELFNNTCMRYHDYLNQKGSIYVMVNNEKDIRKCEPINPLLKDEELLKNNGIEIFANFKYKDILCIKDVLPYSKFDGTIDIEYVLIRKINKNDKMLKSHKLIKLDEQNQGTYIDRNNLNIIRAKKIGYNKKHNSMNGARSYINVDGNWDIILGININKSTANPNSKFYDLLDERLKKVSSHIRKVLQGKVKLNPPTIDISEGRKCNPIIIKDLTREDEKIDIQDKDNEDNKGTYVPPTISAPIDSVPATVSIPHNCMSLNNIDWVSGLVFACKYKSNCRYDSDSNRMLYKRNDDLYLVFDDEVIIDEGIRNKHLRDWWERNGNTSVTLEERIMQSIEKTIFQKKVFIIYKKNIEKLLKDDTPALLPEVELYHNSYTNKENKNYNPQRMDFCLILPNDKKILIELDGIQHISELDKFGTWVASEDKYSEQCLFNNEWQLKGNEIYRISNKTFKDMKEEEIENFITNFFILLFKKHNIIEK